MIRIVSILFHSLLFLLLLLAIDQSFVHLPMTLPGLRQSQSFYLDLRSRLLGMRAPVQQQVIRPAREKQNSVEQLIDIEERSAAGPKPAAKALAEGAGRELRDAPLNRAGESPRYLYPDASGQLQFADHLEEIPEALRSKAQPLAQ